MFRKFRNIGRALISLLPSRPPADRAVTGNLRRMDNRPAARNIILRANGVTLEEIETQSLNGLSCRGYALRRPDRSGVLTFSSQAEAEIAWLAAVEENQGYDQSVDDGR